MTTLNPDLYRAAIDRLVQARKDAGLSQTELAARIASRQTFVSKVELGERRLDVAEYIAICRAIAGRIADSRRVDA